MFEINELTGQSHRPLGADRHRRRGLDTEPASEQWPPVGADGSVIRIASM